MEMKRITGITASLGWVLLLFILLFTALVEGEWAHEQTAWAITAVSVVVMSILPGRLLFLYLVTVILLFGFYLTGSAFLTNEQGESQFQYMYIHLLTSALLLTYWLIQTMLHSLINHNRQLRRRVGELETYLPNSCVLTPTAFLSESERILKAADRNGEQVWSLHYHITGGNKRLRQLTAEQMGEVLVKTVRSEFDLVSIKGQDVFVMLQRTTDQGAERVDERFRQGVRSQFNEIGFPFTLEKSQIVSIQQVRSLLEGVRP